MAAKVQPENRFTLTGEFVLRVVDNYTEPENGVRIMRITTGKAPTARQGNWKAIPLLTDCTNEYKHKKFMMICIRLHFEDGNHVTYLPMQTIIIDPDGNQREHIFGEMTASFSAPGKLLLPDVTLVWVTESSFVLDINRIYSSDVNQRMWYSNHQIPIGQEFPDNSLTMKLPKCSRILLGASEIDLEQGEHLVQFHREGVIGTPLVSFSPSSSTSSKRKFLQVVQPATTNPEEYQVHDAEHKRCYKATIQSLNSVPKPRILDAKFLAMNGSVNTYEKLSILRILEGTQRQIITENCLDSNLKIKFLCIEINSESGDVLCKYIPKQIILINKAIETLASYIGYLPYFPAETKDLLLFPNLSVVWNSATSSQMEFNLTFCINDAGECERVQGNSLLRPGFGTHIYIKMPQALYYLEGPAPENADDIILRMQYHRGNELAEYIFEGDLNQTNSEQNSQVSNNLLEQSLRRVELMHGRRISLNDELTGQFLFICDPAFLYFGKGFRASLFRVEPGNAENRAPRICDCNITKEYDLYRICIRLMDDDRELTTYIPSQFLVSCEGMSFEVTHFVQKGEKTLRRISEGELYIEGLALVWDKMEPNIYRLESDVHYICDENGCIRREAKEKFTTTYAILVHPLPKATKILGQCYHFKFISQLTARFAVSSNLPQYGSETRSFASQRQFAGPAPSSFFGPANSSSSRYTTSREWFSERPTYSRDEAIRREAFWNQQRSSREKELKRRNIGESSTSSTEMGPSYGMFDRPWTYSRKNEHLRGGLGYSNIYASLQEQESDMDVFGQTSTSATLQEPGRFILGGATIIPPQDAPRMGVFGERSTSTSENQQFAKRTRETITTEEENAPSVSSVVPSPASRVLGENKTSSHQTAPLSGLLGEHKQSTAPKASSTGTDTETTAASVYSAPIRGIFGEAPFSAAARTTPSLNFRRPARSLPETEPDAEVFVNPTTESVEQASEPVPEPATERVGGSEVAGEASISSAENATTTQHYDASSIPWVVMASRSYIFDDPTLLTDEWPPRRRGPSVPPTSREHNTLPLGVSGESPIPSAQTNQLPQVQVSTT